MNVLNSIYINYVKRLIDIMIALVGIILLFIPSFIVIFIIYKLKGYSGSIFFTQERFGLNGGRFKIIKFRSMVPDAEAILKADKKLYQKYIENSYKLAPEEDPRLTTIGAFIRRTSIDEFPQFFNILKGDMSFIGPRPILADELSEYSEEEQKELLSVKPGATGWWQVSGRSEVYYPERCELELYYARNISLALDGKIMLLTVKKVLNRQGAH